MKLIKLLLLTVLLLFYHESSIAQTGCLVSGNNTVYTEIETQGLVTAVLATVFGGNQVYKALPIEPSASVCINNSYKVWRPGSQNCNVCPSGYSSNFGVITGCNTTTLVGKISTSEIAYCDLDGYAWALSAAAAMAGFLFIRRRIC